MNSIQTLPNVQLTALVGRFWSRVDKRGPDECWEWMAGRRLEGYGALYFRNQSGKLTCLRAHRLSYEIHNGAIPDGMWVLHHCDNPPCCNPAHLWLGTHNDNMQDMAAKGRGWAKTGTGNPMSKITEDQARRIKYADQPDVMSLCNDIGISPCHASQIRHGKVWKSI